MSTPESFSTNHEAAAEVNSRNSESCESSDQVEPQIGLREQCIRDQVNRSLHEADPLRASLGAACGETFFLQRRVFQMLAPLLRGSEDPMETLDQVGPAFAIFNKLGGQINQFANLLHKMQKESK